VQESDVLEPEEVVPDTVASIEKALGAQARSRYCVVAERNGLRVCWELVNTWNMTLIDVELDPRYPIALRIVDGEIVGAEPAHVMKFLLDEEFHQLVRRYPNALLGTMTVDGRELLRLSREGRHLDLDFVVGTIDALVRVASRLEEAYHLAHAGPYR
jgi:hypothetical protein